MLFFHCRIDIAALDTFEHGGEGLGEYREHSRVTCGSGRGTIETPRDTSCRHETKSETTHCPRSGARCLKRGPAPEARCASN